MKIRGTIEKDGRWWAIEVPVLGISTQGQTKKEAYEMVVDAINMLAGKSAFSIMVDPGARHFYLSSADETAFISFFLKRQRQLQGLSLAEVSERLGYKSRNAYARYEQGRAIPTVTKLSELIRALSPGKEWVLTMS